MSAPAPGLEPEWKPDGDILTALDGIRDDDPARVPTFTPHDQIVRRPMFPENRAVLERVADGVRAINFDTLDAARESAQRYAEVWPQTREFLVRMAVICAERADPIFRDTCPGCRETPGGWCRHHKAKRDEAALFRKLAIDLGGAPTDREAMRLTVTAAAAAGRPAVSEWPGQRDRAVSLLTEAEGMTCPDTYGCCSNESPCGHHAERQEAADFVGAIRDAAIDAGTAAEAALLITAVITDGGK